MLLFACACAGARAQTPLPEGFGPLSLGAPWSEVERSASYTDLTRAGSDWERHVYECGYRSAVMEADDARVLITAQDSRITALSHVTRIEPGSDVMQVAELVMQTYGQPSRATLRDEMGAITIDRKRATFVVLDYDGAVQARFSVSGEPMWEYRVSIEHDEARRLENRTLRCARERHQEPAKQPKSS
jgi:hypothetical protein